MKYLEFTEERMVVRDLDGDTVSVDYIFTDLENGNFLVEVFEPMNNVPELFFEGSFKNKNTIDIIPNPSSLFDEDDSGLQFIKVKNLEKDMEKEKELAKVREEKREKELEKEKEREQVLKEEEVIEEQLPSTEEIFETTCAPCHGSDLSGSVGPALTSIGSKYSKEEIEDIIKDGSGSMPPMLLNQEETEEVAKWLSEMK